MTMLSPDPKIWIRWTAFGLLAILAAIGTSGWFSKLGFWISMAFLFGSYRRAWIGEGRFERQMTLLFFPMQRKTWPLENCTHIEVGSGTASAIDQVLPFPFLRFWMFFWAYALDWCLPWFGGNLKIRLKLKPKGRVLVWQGNSDTNFRANLKILETTTNLPLLPIGR